MNKEFRLIEAIRDIAQGISLSETSEAYINEGKETFRNAGLACSGQIVLPVENRAIIQATVPGQGIEDVSEDKLGIVEALRNKSVLVNAGAQFLTGLKGDVSIPVYSGSNVAWAGETSTAVDGAGNFVEVLLQPKRLISFIDISKQFLIQDTKNAEGLLIADIVRAVNEKLESTLLGNAAGGTTQPAGIFNIVAPTPLTPTFGEIITLEATLENAKVYGNLGYLVSPTAKATLRTTDKSGSSGKFILENNEIEGQKTLSSGNVYASGIVLGNWEDYVIGQWGGIDLTIDPYSQATNGLVRVVINTYFDGAPRRNTSFVMATV
jgi:HK97 family phage major capsid protein